MATYSGLLFGLFVFNTKLKDKQACLCHSLLKHTRLKLQLSARKPSSVLTNHFKSNKASF